MQPRLRRPNLLAFRWYGMTIVCSADAKEQLEHDKSTINHAQPA